MENLTSPKNQLRAANMMLTLITCGIWLPIWIITEIIQAATRKK